MRDLSNKKRILIIQQNLCGGGAEKVLSDILNRFDYNRYDVTLLLIREEGVYLETVPTNVKIKSIYGRDNRMFPRWFYNRFSSPFLPSVKKIELLKLWFTIGSGKKYDCVISFLEGWSLSFHSHCLGKRNISWVHVDLKAMHWTKKFFETTEKERLAYEKMDEIVWVSKQAKDSFQELFDTKFPGKVIYNLIECKKIRENANEEIDNIRNSQYVLCNIGRMSSQKRQDRLVRIVNILINQFNLDVEVWILGEGEKKDEIIQLSQLLGIEDKVKLLGFRKNPYPYVKAADAFVMTSDTEGLPLVVCESLCLGKPVVSTAITGPSELLADDSGILTSLDEEEIASKIYQLLTDKELHNHYCRKAVVRSAIFDPEATMQQIYALIDGTD